ncbi:hypothetical protein E5288_WYG008786 [Bos mutus]|uniref:Uncharacterized protein n=1 Tax=Bos mutus TaxID=72004 RepID=A0A6B0RIV7_9CETA|nr:hypothetical protein [Bos mutus]
MHPHLRVLQRLRSKPTEASGSAWHSVLGRPAPPLGRVQGVSSGSRRPAGVLESQSGLRPTTLAAWSSDTSQKQFLKEVAKVEKKMPRKLSPK